MDDERHKREEERELLIHSLFIECAQTFLRALKGSEEWSPERINRMGVAQDMLGELLKHMRPLQQFDVGVLHSLDLPPDLVQVVVAAMEQSHPRRGGDPKSN